MNKATEIDAPELNEQIQRTFKFPFLRRPILNTRPQLDLTNLHCAKCQTPIEIFPSQTFKLIQQSNTNADDINEVIYCHRSCNAHQHEQDIKLPEPIDLQSELIIVESTDCLIMAKKYVSSNLIRNDAIQCVHCSASIGSFNKNDLISFDKCSFLPFVNEYLSSCFHNHEPGRYIIKVAKSNDSIYLVWILPNEILAGDASLDDSTSTARLNFRRMRKILFAHVNSIDDKNYSEWKRDFSVTTLLVNRTCLEQLSIAFANELKTFPNSFSSNETFQTLTITV